VTKLFWVLDLKIVDIVYNNAKTLLSPVFEGEVLFYLAIGSIILDNTSKGYARKRHDVDEYPDEAFQPLLSDPCSPSLVECPCLAVPSLDLSYESYLAASVADLLLIY
jgi:hypothetical protein